MSIKETPEELNEFSKNTPLFNFNNEMHLAKVVKCYDGDTIHCIFKHDDKYQKFSIRMYSYDTPELRPSKNIPQKERLLEIKKAKEAKKRLQELILDKLVYLECKGFDKYGRILGIVKLSLDDKKSVNDMMVEEGFGKLYFGGSKG